MHSLFRTSLVGIFIFTATLLLNAYVVNKWFQPLYRNTDVWVQTVTPLASDPAVQKAVEKYVITQTFTKIDVEKLVADALPQQASFLAAPIADAVKNVATQVVQKVIQSPQFKDAWVVLNKTIHTQLQAVISGEIDPNKPIQLDLKTLVKGVQEQGMQSLIPVLTDYVTQRAIVRLDIQQYIPALQLIAKYSDRITQMGVVVVAFFMMGIAFAKKRSFAFMASSVLIILSGAFLLIGVKTLTGELKTLSSDPTTQAAIVSIVTTFTAQLVNYARQLASIGFVLFLVGVFVSPFVFARGLRRILGLSWLAKYIKKRPVWAYVRKIRNTLYTYRSGISFGAFLIVVLYLVFAKNVTAVTVAQAVAWWMIFSSLVMYLAAQTRLPVIEAKVSKKAKK